MSSLNSFYFVLALLWPFLSGNGDDLSSFGIKSYKFIRNIHDETQTHRQKRSTIEDNQQRILTLELDHKNLTLVLKSTNEFLSNNADIHLGSSTYLPIDSSILYEGYILDQYDTSYVTGGFYSNWFDGVIKLSNETWHIEPTRRYSILLVNAGPSIIYNSLDIDTTKYLNNQPFRSKRYVMDESFCGLNDAKKREQMNDETERLTDNDFQYRYTRSKRTVSNSTERTCCHIYIRVDPTLWDIVYKNEGLYEKEATIHALVTFLYRTVTAANAIYRSVKFQSNDDFLYRFTLRIKRIRILTNDDCKQTNLSLSEMNICRPYLDSNVFLTWHSAENFAEYCLAYLFSARDFGDGTLGLAWMGTIATNSRGGICEKPARDIYEGKRIIKTLNTGIITVINHHTRTSALMTELTFAHEVGHSLGAEHDEERCDGDARYGHYIMYRRATTGLEDNNNKFSNCSLETMGSVVIAVKNQLSGKTNCLTECSQIGYCGNRNVEDNEECDCGFVSECTDNCCYPAGSSNPNLSCKLKPGARCSPSRGPCCSDQCTFHTTTHICHNDKASQDCIGNVHCDGIQVTCPLNDSRFFKPVDTPCNFNTGLCDQGQCNKSICTLIGKNECSLMIANVAEPLRQRGIDREYLCHIGCFDSRSNSCVDTHTLRMPNNNSKTGFGYIHRPGHACAGTEGYCDVFGKCRAVDAEGPLSRLKNKILSEENIHTLKEIAQDHWWALLLGFLGLMGFMSIFVKVCSVHTPSSNPRMKPARSLSLKHYSQVPRIPPPPTSIEADGSFAQRIQPKIYVRGKTSSDNRTNTSNL